MHGSGMIRREWDGLYAACMSVGCACKAKAAMHEVASAATMHPVLVEGHVCAAIDEVFERKPLCRITWLLDGGTLYKKQLLSATEAWTAARAFAIVMEKKSLQAGSTRRATLQFRKNQNEEFGCENMTCDIQSVPTTCFLSTMMTSIVLESSLAIATPANPPPAQRQHQDGSSRHACKKLPLFQQGPACDFVVLRRVS